MRFRGWASAALAAAVASCGGIREPGNRELAITGSVPAVRISEVHYDNSGTDTGEAIEVSAPVGTDLTGFSVVLYNGNGGAMYAPTLQLSGAAAGINCGSRTVVVLTYPSNGIQNGSPDGIALVDPANTVVEFLSYEGTFLATNGPAAGLLSNDIGVAETGTELPGLSLQRSAVTGWSGPKTSNFGSCNDNDDPVGALEPPIAALDGPYACAEGDQIAMSAAGSLDVDGAVAGYSWDFGDGTSATGKDVTHTYAQDGEYTVVLVVTDEDGLTDTVSTTATVANVAPTIAGIAGATRLVMGETYGAVGGFADPGADVWSATVDYGDGSGEESLALSGMSFSLSHVFGAAGDFTVTVRIADDHVTSTASATVTVTPGQNAIGDAIQMVERLVADGKLGHGVGNSLIVKLAAAGKSLDHGNAAGALGVLQSLVSELEALVRTQRLSTADAEPVRTIVARVMQSVSR